MKRFIPPASILLFALSTAEVVAQRFDDVAVCSRLTRSFSQPTLYISYLPNTKALVRIQDRAICGDDGSFCAVAVNGSNLYDLRSRFYFVGAKSRAEEGVWHIRTQTTAKNLAGADFAFVSRPGYAKTRCSLQPLPYLQGNDRLVNVNRYIDHHPGPGKKPPPDPGLSDAFHFKIEDSAGPCINTDDPAAFRDLNSVYGFEKVERTEQGVAQTFSTSAVANGVRYAGLSSEFAYQDADERVCFGFTAPFPTKSGASANDTWQPRETLVVIKKLKSRAASLAYRNVISWSE